MSTAPCGLLLAGGRGQRYRQRSGLDLDKLMQPLPDGRLVAQAAACALRAAVEQAWAVVRPGSPALAALLQSCGLQVVVADAADQGIGHSLAAGVRATAAASGWIIALADMPYLQASSIQRIAQCLHTPEDLAAPVFRGQRGHPVGLGRAYFAELLALQGDRGARSVLSRHADVLQWVSVDDPGVVQDIDHPEDLQACGRAGLSC